MRPSLMLVENTTSKPAIWKIMHDNQSGTQWIKEQNHKPSAHKSETAQLLHCETVSMIMVMQHVVLKMFAHTDKLFFFNPALNQWNYCKIKNPNLQSGSPSRSTSTAAKHKYSSIEYLEAQQAAIWNHKQHIKELEFGRQIISVAIICFVISFWHCAQRGRRIHLWSTDMAFDNPVPHIRTLMTTHQNVGYLCSDEG